MSNYSWQKRKLAKKKSSKLRQYVLEDALKKALNASYLKSKKRQKEKLVLLPP